MRQLFLVFLLLFASAAHSQGVLNKQISVQFNTEELLKCITKLEKATNVAFSYNSKQLHKAEKKVTQSFQNERLGIILDYLLANTNLKYKEIGGQITIYELKSTDEEIIISGYIRAKNSGEELIGAKIIFPDYGIGCLTNSYGYYAIEVPKGSTTFKVSSLGMLSLTDTVTINQEMVMNISLAGDTLLLNVVEIRANLIEEEEVEDLMQIDKTIITPIAIERVPASTGEKDLLRHIQQLPGVQPANSGAANFLVRGSGTGGNLVLIDEIPIYHPTHLLGIYSIVNTESLKSAYLYKDHIPVQYGTRSSSVLQIHTKEGNMLKHHVSGGISGFMGRLNLEGPIVKNNASFYVSGRVSTFPGPLLNFLGNRQLGQPFFYDLNGKVNVKLNSNNRIYFTGYTGNDRVNDTISNYQWGNQAAAFRWNHIASSKLFSNLSITHSEFRYGFTRLAAGSSLNFGQKVVTDKLAYDFNYYLNNTTRINFGIASAFLRTSKGNDGSEDANLFLNRQSWENGIYAAVSKSYGKRLKVNAGARIPFSFHVGTGDTTSYLNSDYSLTRVIYEKGKFYDALFFIDPRVVASYRLTPTDELQFAAMVTSQNTHIINYINYFLPIEIWTPSSTYLKPERNYQASIGWTHQQKGWQFSAVGYKKYVANVLDYASPVFTSSTDIESNLLSGKLNVWGAEFMLTYTYKKWYSAAISYAYTKTRQEVDGINNNQPYVAPSDRPHYLSFSQYFNLTPKWQISTNYTTHSGTAVTLPNGQFVVNGTAFPLYTSERNTSRLSTFGRVDLSFRRQLGVKKNKDNWHLLFTITNFFGRYNPSVAYSENDPNQPDVLLIKTLDYSPAMISLNLNFKF